jgi:cation diffusion facilitator CzcD-associated flavoprotein CzcO
VVTADGTEREVDALVVATGFHTTDLPVAGQVTGRDGRTMAEHFAEHGMQAYKGATVTDFPNLFFIVGPNTGLGHSSMVFMIEAQVAYLVDALETMTRQGLAAVEPRPEAQQGWNADVQRRMRRTVWNTGGCSSWYLDDHGRNTTLWPGTTFRFRRELRRFDPEKYVVTARSGATTTQEQVA